mgnify:CR=1 FL=1
MVEAPRLPELSLVAGGAVAQAIAEVTGLEPAIKFPNDILVRGRKVAGILAESSEGRVVLGIGVNVNQTLEQLPADAETEPTSLRLELGGPVSRARLLAGDPAGTRARLRRLGYYGYFSVRLTFPAASLGDDANSAHATPGRKEKTPARTDTADTFSVHRRADRRGLAHAKAQLCERRARASTGATVSIRNSAVCTGPVPMSFVTVRTAAYLPSFKPDGRPGDRLRPDRQVGGVHGHQRLAGLERCRAVPTRHA